MQQEALDIINTISDSEVKNLLKIYDVRLANKKAGNYLIAIYTKLEPVINNEKTMDFSHDENLKPFHYFEKLINCYKIANRHIRFILE